MGCWWPVIWHKVGILTVPLRACLLQFPPANLPHASQEHYLREIFCTLTSRRWDWSLQQLQGMRKKGRSRRKGIHLKRTCPIFCPSQHLQGACKDTVLATGVPSAAASMDTHCSLPSLEVTLSENLYPNTSRGPAGSCSQFSVETHSILEHWQQIPKTVCPLWMPKSLQQVLTQNMVLHIIITAAVLPSTSDCLQRVGCILSRAPKT